MLPVSFTSQRVPERRCPLCVTKNMSVLTTKKHWPLTGLLLLAYCGLALLGPQGLVLCQGQDGHVAVEAAPLGAYCGDFSFSPISERPAIDAALHVDHCGFCRDTALALDVVRVEPKRNLVDPVSWPMPAVMPSLRNKADLCSKVSLMTRDHLAIFPSFLRSTVLLI